MISWLNGVSWLIGKYDYSQDCKRTKAGSQLGASKQNVAAKGPQVKLWFFGLYPSLN